MINNSVLRSIRYTFDFKDSAMVEIFALGGREVTEDDVSRWLKKEEDPKFRPLTDADMRAYLDGLIGSKRGTQEKAPVATPDQKLTNNAILRKLKIALNLQSDAFIAVLALAKVTISKHELSALFRGVGHKHYRECQDQFLRNFLKGLQLTYRPVAPKKDIPQRNKK